METLSKHWLSISILTIVATLAGLLTAQNAKQPTSRPAAHPTTQPAVKVKPLIRVIPEPDTQTEESLNRIVDFKTEVSKCEDIIHDIFIDVYKLNIVMNWQALDPGSSEIRSQGILLDLKKVTLRKALEAVLELASNNDIKLGYVVKNGVIYIDPVENLNAKMVTRIYDCSDLFFAPQPTANKSNLFPVTKIPNNTSSEYGYSLDGMFPLEKDNEEETNLCTDPPVPGTPRYYQQIIQDMIEKASNYDSWNSQGGTAQLTWLGSLLMVKQTPENHRRILALLENLRKMQKLKQERQPLVIRAWWVSGGSKEWDDLQSKLKKDSSSELTAQMLTAVAPNTLAVGRGFNRQPLLLTNGNGQLLVTGVEPIVSDNTAISAPVTQNIFFGKMLRITATLRNENKEAIVDIDSLASSLQQVAQKPYKDSNGNFAIDAPIYQVGELKTQTTIPVGKPLLIGGFTTKPQGNATPKTPAEPLMLFVQIDLP